MRSNNHNGGTCRSPMIKGSANRSSPPGLSSLRASQQTGCGSPRLERLLHLAGDNSYERFDLTGKPVGPVAVQNARSLNREIERALLRGLGGRYLRYAT